MTDEKARLYKTAQATIACALFDAGAIVSVQFQRREADGTFWFRVAPSTDGPHTYYPEHHLTRFVL